ncbi:hypothetical protein GUJ93_ZPchr0015g6636 [Zizania palustris]|uniref:Uncharacterized protein n=1 Tax=Zizania palustris TaxID=103762 RepID=A0A8J5VVJ5_ZIZPA|nr:hypothetical protein GUJ93_ZPchr0015g6636 [Zizania palustris]
MGCQQRRHGEEGSRSSNAKQGREDGSQQGRRCVQILPARSPTGGKTGSSRGEGERRRRPSLGRPGHGQGGWEAGGGGGRRRRCIQGRGEDGRDRGSSGGAPQPGGRPAAAVGRLAVADLVAPASAAPDLAAPASKTCGAGAGAADPAMAVLDPALVEGAQPPAAASSP